jgi:hypothetical protein
METKLTLKLDDVIINQAKKYALKRKKSISRLVEDYFRGLGNDEISDETTINPIVRELSGIIDEKDIKGWEADYSNYLEQKYE